MHVYAALNPLEQRRVAIDICPGSSLAAIARKSITDWCAAFDEDPEHYGWFFEHGVMRVNGVVFERAMWAHVKPKSHAVVELAVIVHNGKTGKILLILGAVALTVATGFIASGGLAGALGSGTLAAGSTGASLAAGSLGLAGTLALHSLTPTPSLPKPTEQRELSMAGVQGNALTVNEVLASVVGRMAVSPQILAPAFTTLEKGNLYAHVMVGLHGRNLVEDVKINGLPIASIPDVTFETREGTGSDADTFLSNSFQIHENGSVELSNSELKNESSYKDLLADQLVPTNSYSKYHPLPDFKAEASDYGIRLLFEGGISSAGVSYGVPFRLRLRLRGDTIWRELPTIHIRDIKAAGPFRQEIRLRRVAVPPSGLYFCQNDNVDTRHVMCGTGPGQPFAWSSDSYFVPEGDGVSPVWPAVMTSATDGTTTISASSELTAGTPAWKAVDSNVETYWSPALDALPAWWQVDFGAGNAKTIRGCEVYGQLSNDPVWPKSYEVKASQDGTNWTSLGAIDFTDFVGSAIGFAILNLQNNTAYRFYRVTISKNNGAASGEIRVERIRLLEREASISQATTGGLIGSYGNAINYARYARITEDGVELYLKNSNWPAGIYEVGIRRGWAYQSTGLQTNVNVIPQYIYDGAGNLAHFFDHVTQAGLQVIRRGQKDVQSKAVVETTFKVFPFRPIAASVEPKLTRIAIRVRNMQIQSISARLTAYARTWDGTAWSATPVPTRNPAAPYREALLRAEKNATPIDQGLLIENSLEGYFSHCATNAITCDAVLQDRNVHDVLVLLAAVGRASPRQGNMWGITIDHNRSAETPVGMLTPETSRDLGTRINFQQVPHGLRISYFDEADEYRQKNLMVYRAGYNSGNATLIEGMPNYDGIVTAAAAIAQGTYDMGQAIYRRASFTREVGTEGMSYARGVLLALSDDVVSQDVKYDLVRATVISGGNVTGFKFYGTVKLTGVVAPLGFGVMVRKKYGGVHVAAIVETTDTNVVTLQVPVPDTGQFNLLQPVSVGPLGNETRRVVVNKITPSGPYNYQIELLPEGNAIFA